MELGYTFGEQRLLFPAEEGGADSHALLCGAHRVEREHGDARDHQLARQLQVVHAGILHGEVEAVGQRCAHIVVIDQIEAVGQEHVLHELGSASVLLHVVEEAVLSAHGSLHQRGHSVLHGVRRAAGEGVHQSAHKEVAEGPHSEFLLQGRKRAVVELVGDARHTASLAGIGEGLRGRNPQHVVVRVAGHGGLEGRLERMREVAAEVHGEVSQVLQHDDVVLRGQLSDAPELFLREADPRGVIRVGIDDGRDVALGDDLLQLGDEVLSAIAVDVERFVLDAEHVTLRRLHGESGLYEQHGVLPAVGVGVLHGQEGGEGALHAARGGHAALGVDVHTDEGFHKLGGRLLDAGDAAVGRIGGGAALTQSFLLGLQSDLRRLQTGHTHLQMDHLFSGALLDGFRQRLHVAYRGLGEVPEPHRVNDLYDFFSF